MNNFVSYTIRMLHSLQMYNKQFERKKTMCLYNYYYLCTINHYEHSDINKDKWYQNVYNTPDIQIFALNDKFMN